MTKQLIRNIITTALCSMLLGCVSDTEIDEIFEENTQERVFNSLDKFNQLLLSSEFGWETAYMPGNETGVYKMHLKFNEDGSVIITSDHNNGNNDIETNYRVDISQSPELVFENYSTFSNLTDSFDGTDGGFVNFDRGAEFQFTFTEVASEDEIVLESKSDLEIINEDDGEVILSKTVLILKKATENSINNIVQLRNLDVRITGSFNPVPTVPLLPFRGFRIENSSTETILSTSFSYDEFNRAATFVYENAEEEQINEIIGTIVTLEGFDLSRPFVFNDTAFESFVYNEATNEFIAEVNGQKAIVTRGNLPFYINRDSEEIRSEGFDRLIYRPNLGRSIATSDAFIVLTNQISEALSSFDVTLFEIRINFLLPDPSLPIDSSINNNPNLSRALIRFSVRNNDGAQTDYNYIHRQEVVDRKLRFYFDFAEDDGVSENFQPIFQDLLDFFGTEEGIIYTATGSFIGVNADGTVQSFSNLTGRFLSTENPSLGVYMIWVDF